MTTTRQVSILAPFVLTLFTAGKSINAQDVGRKDGKPNVLFIAIDDLNNWTDMLKGNPLATTPHMDKLASKGIVFTNAHCAAPVCGPLRSCTTYAGNASLY